ncbi:MULTISPECIES: cytochrome ubiquinol oxidase subunit I [unclassified Microbacterium]|uniref:cytochrome ubiquinol oxidase subunit I n=1 Tax=unclassified Microbacterium TaxID=2609290 RepID=UPI0010FF28D9|nr:MULTISPECIES: cytochrome ubiquinol oxidase subunit I [unclassified Microbacterium]MBT9607338.1 cytochrome ubiquinol oxidase subunit I [Microbacterium sp.]TLF32242.1 cytochrome ubiquinol oxidase subunit I [Microbacterium sp. 5K110]CAH0278602.1 Cytochrome bd ubiquinol oxidase subunit 1 [Microbacterium sp. Bi128]
MEWLDPLMLARWQFGLTTLYHFLFVPLTLGMSLVVAIFQTVWYRTGDVKWLHLTRFFGKIFLINFAMGVVTGIVQEFQFGMNWSAYSRFVGDVFGAPLAFEGLLAFFLEATFIGLWIFGWDKLPRLAHLGTIWMATLGATFSAYFIIAANAFMQNPVGYQMAADGGRAELVDFWAMLTNPVALAAFPHTIFSGWMFAAMVVVSISAWHLARGRNVEMMRAPLRFGLWSTVVSFVLVAIAGDQLSLVMVATQPMKMAAAEATFNTVCGANASFSIFTLGTPDGTSELFSIRVPFLLSILSTHSLDGCVEGINDLNTMYSQQMFPQFADQVDGNFAPVLWVTYWAFRWMIALGGLATLISVVGLWVTRKKATRPVAPWMWRVAIWAAPLPLLGSLVGWVFTEMGRQPWIVFGLMLTEDGVSPSVPGWSVLISLVAFTAIYAALAVVEFGLIKKYAQKGPDPLPDPNAPREPDSLENTPTTVY